jgi:hypothetical protein
MVSSRCHLMRPFEVIISLVFIAIRFFSQVLQTNSFSKVGHLNNAPSSILPFRFNSLDIQMTIYLIAHKSSFPGQERCIYYKKSDCFTIVPLSLSLNISNKHCFSIITNCQNMIKSKNDKQTQAKSY